MDESVETANVNRFCGHQGKLMLKSKLKFRYSWNFSIFCCHFYFLLPERKLARSGRQCQQELPIMSPKQTLQIL